MSNDHELANKISNTSQIKLKMAVRKSAEKIKQIEDYYEHGRELTEENAEEDHKPSQKTQRCS